MLGVITQCCVGQDALLVSIREEYVDGVEVNITHVLAIYQPCNIER